MNTTNTITGTSSSIMHMYTIIHTSQCSTRRHQEGNLSLDTAVKSGNDMELFSQRLSIDITASGGGVSIDHSFGQKSAEWRPCQNLYLLTYLLSLHSDYFSIYLGYDTTFNITYLGLLLLYWYSRVWTEEYLCICVWYSYMHYASQHARNTYVQAPQMLATTTAVL